jgi:hypothetical protein
VTERPVCPICREPFDEGEYDSLASALGQPDETTEMRTSSPELDIYDVRPSQSPPAAGERAQMAASPSAHFLRCSNGDEIAAEYIFGTAPTYVVSLFGLAKTGKTHLLVALARLALGENAALWGYRVSIADRSSKDFYSQLLDTLFVKREEIPTSNITRPLGLHFASAARQFNLLFVDTPGEDFVDELQVERRNLHVVSSDLTILLIDASTIGGLLTSSEEARRTKENLLSMITIYQGLMARRANAPSQLKVPSASIVAISKADLLVGLMPQPSAMANLIKDAGTYMQPGAVSSEAARQRVFNFNHPTPGVDEWDAIFWQHIHTRIIARQASPQLLLALTVLPNNPLFALVSATGSSPAPDPSRGASKYFRVVQPQGVAGLLFRVLHVVGEVPVRPAHSYVGRLRYGSGLPTASAEDTA